VDFGEREEIEALSVGDRVGWQIVPAGRRLFIRAMEENAHTNMTIVTNERAYQFDLRSSDSDAVFGSEELTYVVRFYYPEEGELAHAPTPVLAPQQVVSAYPYHMHPMATAAPVAPVQQGYAMPTQQPGHYPQASPYPYAPQFAPAPYSQAMPYGQPAYTQMQPYQHQPPLAYAPPQPQPHHVPYVAEPRYNAPTHAAPSAAHAPAARRGSGLKPSVNTPQKTPAARPAPSPLQPIATPRPSASGRPDPSADINYKYTYSGSSKSAPVKIFDDGQSTYFKFRNGVAMPEFSIITRRGEEIAVPHTINADGLAVINIVSPRFSLRQGTEQVIVYNEAQAT
jgi:type IV secretory pathway VirB9-like protein